MKNEPVAWMLNGILHECDPSDWAKEQYPDQDVIPLYAHPVKELTEYMKYRLAVKKFGEGFCITYRSELLAYADAILRKAQEK